MGAVTKAINKIIPKEIKPILPFAASMFGAPLIGSALGGLGTAGGILGSSVGSRFLGKAITGGLTNLATQGLMGGKISPRSAIVSSLLSGGGGFLRSDLANTAFGKNLAPSTLEALKGVGQVLDPAEITKEGTYSLTGTGEGLSPITRPGYAALTVGGAEAAYQSAEEEQKRFDEEQAASEASQQADMAARADYLRNYGKLAGYSDEEVQDMLDRYGYSGYLMGGRVGYEGGGPTLGDKAQDLKILLMKNAIIESGKLGFDVKDLDTYSDDKIIEIHESIFGKKNGGRIGYEFGGMSEATENLEQEDLLKGISSLQRMVMPFLKGVPSEEKIEEIRQNKIKEYMEDVDYGEYPSMEFMEKTKEMVEGKADDYIKQYLDLIYKYEDILPYKSRPNPPEGSVSMDVIEQIMGPRKEGRVEEAKGGLINMRMGGMPAEMDLRPGGFVPIGRQERADDVPARLSKNEFVMTADAVRAAGGGSVNKGAKRMYDLMNKLEARV